MGGALAWLQSQLWIGCCPGNGTSDLIYPLSHTPRRTCTPPSPMHASFAAHIPRHSSLCGSWNSSPCTLSSSQSSHGCSHLHAEQVRESNQAAGLAAAVLMGIVWQRFAVRCLQSSGGNIKRRRRLQDCTLVHSYRGP